MARQFNYPTTMLFGEDAVDELAKRLGKKEGKRLLLVTDPGLVRLGVAPAIQKKLEDAGLGICTFSEVQGNPTEDDVDKGTLAYQNHKAQGIVALGGGSPMDVAKGIAVRVFHPPPISRYDDAKGGDQYITGDIPPIYAIPTTAGTGSEVGRASVIIARDTKKKTIVFHPKLLPSIAVLDPTLTMNLPAHITARTGLDAFTHGLEAYLAKGFHPIADAMALGCMELVINHLPKVMLNPRNLESRGNMLIAASMGAAAFQKGLGMVHSLAHPLSTHYGMHHGLTNALLLPPVLSWHLESRQLELTDDLLSRYRRIVNLFPKSETQGSKMEIQELPAAIFRFCQEVGIKETLVGEGLKAKDIPQLAADAFDDPSHLTNPIPISRDDLAAVYRRCL